MLNSLLMLGSTNNMTKKLKYVFAIIWIVYMLLNSNSKTSLIFTVVNLTVFLCVFALAHIVKEKHSNNVISILSIIIWSVIIDIISYFMYPQFTFGQNILSYVSNGMLFNFKYVFTNIIVVLTLNVIVLVVKKIKNFFLFKNKKITFNS